MADGNGNGVTVTQDRIFRWGALLLLIGGGIARYEYRQTRMEERLWALEQTVQARGSVMERAVQVLEQYDRDNGISGGSSTRERR